MGKPARHLRSLAALMGVALALTTTACGGATDASTMADTVDISGSISGQTINYWSMWKDGEPQQKVIAAAIADFEKETGAKVSVQWQGRSNSEKLVPALNTNNVPDLVDGTLAKLAPVIGETGQASPLTSVYSYKVDDTSISEVIPQKFTSNGAFKGEDGQPWMVPYSVSSDGIWFDAAKHPELKDKPPATWDEFINVLDKLKASGTAPIAADGDIAGYNATWFVTSLLRLKGAGSFKALVEDKSGDAWDAPEVLEAARKVENLVKGGYLNSGYNASKFPAQQQLWANGDAALMLNGSWTPTETGSYAVPGFEYSSFQFPAMSDKPASARVDFIGFAVPAKSKNQVPAQRLAAFMLNSKYQNALGTEAKVLPVRPDAPVAAAVESVKAAIDAAPATHLQNDGVTFPGYMEKVFFPKDDELFLGKSTADEFVGKMKAAQIQYWKDNG
ncbi:ABC transporter substrate-binding protein [Paenarthrobacter sp. AR 02]|uniref:ABC transporter substrate-binding protein n=1 Tax=Paenarthrobacter sp. AR 02 TaxID=2899821 RepID=UPI001F1E5DE5|nr:ABC transporter substrate-binding protein [Paenarthrobacter sp. AR 02]MCF3138166.1 ABC transporter substrate-binding protein [Paenarthrobacter sp. AR 02]